MLKTYSVNDINPFPRTCRLSSQNRSLLFYFVKCQTILLIKGEPLGGRDNRAYLVSAHLSLLTLSLLNQQNRPLSLCYFTMPNTR